MKRQFLASVYQEGDWFIAEAHEVAVASQGKTEEEALANLKEALEFYFEPPVATKIPKQTLIEVDIAADSAALLS
jgi:predicted RNase H-like HicB family nuclease